MISLDNLKTILYAIKCILTDYPKKRDIPTKLPNPNPLIFTGAVTGSYDGSEPLNVNIPSGGSGGDDYITLNVRPDDSKVVLNESQMPVIADKTVDEVMTEVNAGKKRVKIYMEGDPEPIIMNLSAINPALSFSLLIGGEEFGS